MKLDHLPEYITIVVTTILGMLLAVYLGTAAGSGSNMPLTIAGGVIALAIALIMRERIWILIPLFWPITGQIKGLPGSFPVRDVAIMYVFPIFIALKALKVVRTNPRYNWLDYLLFANVVYMVSVYIRNPVGTDSMGFEKIGGKPYFEAVFALMGYWVIAHMTISTSLAWKFPVITVAGQFFTSITSFLTFHIPSLTPVIGSFYTGVDSTAYAAQDASYSDDGPQRQGFLGNLGGSILLTLYSWFPPLTTINPLYIWRFFFFAIGMIAVLKSGFRSTILSAAGFFFLATYFRSGIWGIIRTSVLAVPILVLLVVAQGSLINLPAPVQRTLSFLPANWDASVLDNANDSVDWRLDIWSNVWNSGHKYIENWWFGDGFGMTRRQLQEANQNYTDAKENLTVSGDYHSLPLSAIHTVGYVGFAIFLILYFSLAVAAFKLIKSCRETPYFSIALFIGIPLIYAPFPTLLLTGFFKLEFVQGIFSVAMLGLVRRSLEKYKSDQKSEFAQTQAAASLPWLESTAAPEAHTWRRRELAE